MKQINIYSRKSLHTSYSCILYLKGTLEKYTNVTLWSHTPNNDIDKEYKKNSHSFYQCWYGNIRGLRVLLAKIKCFNTALRGEQVLVIHDLDFFISAYFARKINRKLTVIHYNTEIYGEDVKYPSYILKFYEKHANFPDMIIECLKERADYRKKLFNIRKKIYVINNTLPQKYGEKMEKEEAIDNNVLIYKKKLPIVIYAGGCDRTRGLSEIIDAMKALEGKCNFLLFLDNSNFNYNLVLKDCKEFIRKDMCHVYPAVSRNVLFSYMRKCDIGINYYNPLLNANHLYAAPSKIFEYMAMGLKILSTDNQGIDSIIEDNLLGKCFKSKEDFIRTIFEIIKDDNIKNKTEIKKLFNEKYCYEVDSKVAIDNILFLAR